MQKISLALLLFAGGTAVAGYSGTLTRYPQRVVSELEKLASQLKVPFEQHEPRRALYVYFNQRDWSYPRNTNSGVILGREASVTFGSQSKDGKCLVQQLVVGQEKLGATEYGPLYVRDVKDNDGHPQHYFLNIPCSDIGVSQAGLQKESCPQCVLGSLGS